MSQVINSYLLQDMEIPNASQGRWYHISNGFAVAEPAVIVPATNYVGRAAHIHSIAMYISAGANVCPESFSAQLLTGCRPDANEPNRISTLAMLWGQRPSSVPANQYGPGTAAGADLWDQMGSCLYADNHGSGWSCALPNTVSEPSTGIGFTLQFLFPEPPTGQVTFQAVVRWSDNSADIQQQPNNVAVVASFTGV